MFGRDIVLVYCDRYLEQIDVKCGVKMAVNVKVLGTYSNQYD